MIKWKNDKIKLIVWIIFSRLFFINNNYFYNKYISENEVKNWKYETLSQNEINVVFFQEIEPSLNKD